MLCFYVKYRVLRFFSYLCTQNIIVMVDKSYPPKNPKYNQQIACEA